MKHFAQKTVVTLILLGSCATAVPFDDQRQPIHDFTEEWSRKGPMVWLNTLSENPSATFYVEHASADWIKEGDLRPLVAAMNSTSPAAAVCYFASAHAVPASFQSTVGREASLLLNSVRRQRAYPGNCSDLSAVDSKELLQWWARRKE